MAMLSGWATASETSISADSRCRKQRRLAMPVSGSSCDSRSSSRLRSRSMVMSRSFSRLAFSSSAVRSATCCSNSFAWRRTASYRRAFCSAMAAWSAKACRRNPCTSENAPGVALFRLTKPMTCPSTRIGAAICERIHSVSGASIQCGYSRVSGIGKGRWVSNIRCRFCVVASGSRALRTACSSPRSAYPRQRATCAVPDSINITVDESCGITLAT